MIEFARRIAPLLIDLDKAVSIDKPVKTDVLIELFKQHSGAASVTLFPMGPMHTFGVHLRVKAGPKIMVFYAACSSHPLEKLDPGCPGCQWARFSIAKELTHSLDCNGELTSPSQAEALLLKELLEGSWNANPMVQSDSMAMSWALELLVRFCNRVILSGNRALAPSQKLITARASDDYSDLARQYAVPQQIIAQAFNDDYMSLMKDIRRTVGLPLMSFPDT